MFVIAITGSIGSGKSSALKYFQKKGYPTISADEVVHWLYQESIDLQDKIVNLTGESVRNQYGINRKRLADIIFTNHTIKEEVEEVVHEAVLKEIRDWVNKNKDEEIGFVEVPLLFEANAQQYYDYSLMIAIDEKIQVERLVKIRGMSVETVQKRIQAQMPQNQKIKLADSVIQNNGTIAELETRLQLFVEGVEDDIRKNESIS